MKSNLAIIAVTVAVIRFGIFLAGRCSVPDQSPEKSAHFVSAVFRNGAVREVSDFTIFSGGP